MPRLPLKTEISSGQVSILWSRARGFDNHPGTWFEPNHFIPVINKRQLNDGGREKHDKSSKSLNTVKPKSQPTLFSFQKKFSTLRQTPPSKPIHKKTAEMAGMGDCSKAKKKPELSATNEGHKRKFLSKWKKEFLLLIFLEKNNSMTCSICLQAPEVAGKSQFISGLNSVKKETIQIHGSSNGHFRAMAAV